jgi:NAD-dependent dihydropyrimidine dehydrogenase PreA subunit
VKPIKYIWGMFFRLFPCPTEIGLRRIGNPNRQSPVMVTCNFFLTVRRLLRKLKAVDTWLLIVDSKGVNVWCAAGANDLNTHSVVAVVKTSGIADLVDHRILILPPLSAPGIKAAEVKKQTGWSVRWGPTRLDDIPAYLRNGQRRSEKMKRVSYNWKERLDTAAGSLFPFFFTGAIGLLAIAPDLLLNYLVVGSSAFVFFMLACPWLPGKRGLSKVIWLEIVLAIALIVSAANHLPSTFSIRADIIIAMVMLMIYGSELGGLSATMPSELDPFLARIGIGAVGNVAFAGTVRTELLNGLRVLAYLPENCIGCHNCIEVCPQGCWSIYGQSTKIRIQKQNCTACTACILQCEGNAIKAERQIS